MTSKEIKFSLITLGTGLLFFCIISFFIVPMFSKGADILPLHLLDSLTYFLASIGGFSLIGGMAWES